MSNILYKLDVKLEQRRNNRFATRSHIFGGLCEQLVCEILNLKRNSERFNTICDAKDENELTCEIKGINYSRIRIDPNKENQKKKCLAVDRLIAIYNNMDDDFIRIYELDKEDREEKLYYEPDINNKLWLYWDVEKMRKIYEFEHKKTADLLKKWSPAERARNKIKQIIDTIPETIIKYKPKTKLQRIYKLLEWNMKDKKKTKLQRIYKLLEWNMKDKNNLRSNYMLYK